MRLFKTYKIIYLQKVNSDMYKDVMKIHPSGHMTVIQRRMNVDATSWRCLDGNATLYKRHVPAGISLSVSNILDINNAANNTHVVFIHIAISIA